MAVDLWGYALEKVSSMMFINHKKPAISASDSDNSRESNSKVLLFLSSIQPLQVLTQECLCRTARASASLFPVLQGAGADAQLSRKVLLAEVKSLPCLNGLGGPDPLRGGQ